VSRLIYAFLASLDGYIADEAGTFDWAAPDEDVLDFINAAEREVGTYLYGRTMYEMMTGWETDPAVAAQSPKERGVRRDLEGGGQDRLPAQPRVGVDEAHPNRAQLRTRSGPTAQARGRA